MLIKFDSVDILEIYFTLADFIDEPDIYGIQDLYDKFVVARHTTNKFLELSDDEIEKLLFLFYTSDKNGQSLIPRFQTLQDRKVYLNYDGFEEFLNTIDTLNISLGSKFDNQVKLLSIAPLYEIDTILWEIRSKAVSTVNLQKKIGFKS